MRRFFASVCLVVALAALLYLTSDAVQQPASPSIPVMPVNQPVQPAIQPASSLLFIENQGQVEDAVRFHVEGGGHTVLFGPQAIRFRRTHTAEDQPNIASEVTLRFLHAQPEPAIEPMAPLPGVVNYYRGSDAADWRTGLPTFEGIQYRNLYPGIDMMYTGQQERLKREFHVAPGADPSLIQMQLDGVESLRLRDDGALVAQTVLGELVESAPVLFQTINGQRIPVSGAFRLEAGTVGFEVGAYDPAIPLIIDPEITFASYLGGSGTDSVNDLVVSSSGDVFVGGRTNSADFPTQNAAQGAPAGGDDFFIMRFDPTTGAILYSTFLGGSEPDRAEALVLDEEDNIYVLGRTLSSDFPTLNPLQAEIAGDQDLLVAKLDANGALVFSTYLGGSDREYSSGGIDLAPEGDLWLAGYSRSPDYPTTANALQSTREGDSDFILTRLTSDGSTLLYSTYLGGNDSEFGGGFDVDQEGNLYIAGSTESDDLVNENLEFAAILQKIALSIGNDDIEYSISGRCVADGPGRDSFTDVEVVGDYVIASGITDGGIPTTAGAFQSEYAGGLSDGMVAACNLETMEVAYLSYYGTANDEFLDAISGYSLGETLDVLVPLNPLAGDFGEQLTTTVCKSTLTDDGAGQLIAEDTCPVVVALENANTNAVDSAPLFCYLGLGVNSASLTTTDNAIQTTQAGFFSGAVMVIEEDPRPMVEIKKTAFVDEFTVGDQVAFRIVVTNTGEIPLTNVKIGDVFSTRDLRIFSDSESGFYLPPTDFLRDDTGSIIWDLPSLASQDSFVVDLVFYTRSSNLFNSAYVNSDEGVVARTDIELTGTYASVEGSIFRGRILSLEDLHIGDKATRLPETIDVYLDSVLVANDLEVGDVITFQDFPIGQAFPLVEITDGADPDRSNPVDSIALDLVYQDENGTPAFPSRIALFLTEVDADSSKILVKPDPRTEAEDASQVEFFIANTTLTDAPLSLRILDDTGNPVQTITENLPADSATAYFSLAPGLYNMEVSTDAMGKVAGQNVFQFDWTDAAGEALALVAAGPDSALVLLSLDASGNVGIPVSTEEAELPNEDFVLHGNYPNPFSKHTTLTFDLAATADVTVDVFDVRGQQVYGMPAKRMAPGVNQKIELQDLPLASGAYFYRITAWTSGKKHVRTGQMVLLK